MSRSKSHPHSHCNRSISFRRHTSCSSSSHCSTLHHPSANGCSHHPSCHDSHTPSCTHLFTHRCHSCHSVDWSQSCSSNTHHTVQGSQPRNVKQHPRPSNPINLTAPRQSPSRIPLHTLHLILTVTLILERHTSSDKDEWGRHSSNHYTIGLLLDGPTVTVHAGKRFKVLNDTRAALLLVHTSVYTMVEYYCKTKILPAAVHLKAVDGSAMSSLGKATLHL